MTLIDAKLISGIRKMYPIHCDTTTAHAMFKQWQTEINDDKQTLLIFNCSQTTIIRQMPTTLPPVIRMICVTMRPIHVTTISR